MLDPLTEIGQWYLKLLEGLLHPLAGDQLWTSSDTLAENVDTAGDTTPPYWGHYKKRIVQNWQTCNPR